MTTKAKKQTKTATAKQSKYATGLRTKDTEFRCQKGYHFEEIGRGRIALMKDNGDPAGMTARCKCYESGGSCQIERDGVWIRCVEEHCAGACGFSIESRGIVGTFALSRI